MKKLQERNLKSKIKHKTRASRATTEVISALASRHMVAANFLVLAVRELTPEDFQIPSFHFHGFNLGLFVVKPASFGHGCNFPTVELECDYGDYERAKEVLRLC